jgi:hypothetical protein
MLIAMEFALDGNGWCLLYEFWHFVFYVVVSSLVTMCDIVMKKRWFWCYCSVGLRLKVYLVKVNCIININNYNITHRHKTTHYNVKDEVPKFIQYAPSITVQSKFHRNQHSAVYDLVEHQKVRRYSEQCGYNILSF